MADGKVCHGLFLRFWLTRPTCQSRAIDVLKRSKPFRNSLRKVPNPETTASRCLPPMARLAQWSLTSLQLKLIKIGARVVRHARAITFQLAEVAVTGPMVRAILASIRRLRAPPSCA